jgi:predicted ABC-type ATPase
LSAKSYVTIVKNAKDIGFKVNLLYFWLLSPEFAKQRVALRVRMGGHNIPPEVIERRYYRGINNLLNLYIPIVNNWLVIDNMRVTPHLIAQGSENTEKVIINSELWNTMVNQSVSYGK